VYIKFIITETGDIKEVKIRKSSGNDLLDAEAVRVITEMPKWSPAHLDGELVESTFSIPISFKLD
jgi:TonB family protein